MDVSIIIPVLSIAVVMQNLKKYSDQKLLRRRQLLQTDAYLIFGGNDMDLSSIIPVLSTEIIQNGCRIYISIDRMVFS